MTTAAGRSKRTTALCSSQTPRWNRASPQARGLVAWWPLAPCTGNVLPDAWGGRHGVVSDVAWTAGAEFGAVPSFDGAREGGFCDTGLPAGAAPRTLNAWVKYSETPLPGYTRGILFYGTRDFDRGVCLAAGSTSRWQPPGCLGVSQWGKELVTPRAYHDGAWHQLVATFDGVTWSVYVDGVLANVRVLPTDTRPAEGRIGGFNFGPHYRWKGWIRDARIYARALSAAEIWTLYDPATRFDLYLPRRQPWARAVTANPVFLVRGGQVHVAGAKAGQVFLSGATAGELAAPGKE